MQRGQDAYHATKQREGDWAVAGGIASGIAGPAAGLAAAADIQRKNAEIRAQNDNLRTAVNTVTGHALMEISSRKNAAEKQLKKWREKEKKAELLLVQEYPAEELLKKLKPELVSAVQSDTGAVLIKAKISAVHGAIYDNVSAVADGTIKAVLWEGDTRVGEALLTLPYDGAKTGGTNLEGICRSGPVLGKEYTVTFEPYKLWMIEG